MFSSLAVFVTACGEAVGPGTGATADPNATAATVNGKAIKMEEVDRAVKQQAQGQEGRLSPMELAGARLQVLDSLIQQEVMFQKAEKEGTVPSEEDVTAELNKQKTQSGKSSDQIAKEMADQGFTEAMVRDGIKKGLAIQRLIDKVYAKVEAPKDSEIEQFYAGNKEAFVKKKGVKLAAIVIDPAKNFEGDTSVDEASAVAKGNEVIKKLQAGQDFAQVARENSEDQSRFQGGDLGYLAEDDLKQAFPAQTVANLMNPGFEVGKILTTQAQGKFFIMKLQERSDRDEAVTLETPGVRQQVIESLTNARKQLLQASYSAVAMNEAKVENLLARKVVDSPNDWSGARPAGAAPPANTNTAPASNTVTNGNANVAASNTNAPAANANANRPANANR